MFAKTFFKDASERALSTIAQTFVALAGTNAADFLDLPLLDAVKASIVAGVLSMLKSFAASRGPIGDESASLVRLKG